MPGSWIVGQLVTRRERPIGVRGVIAAPPVVMWVPGSSVPGTREAALLM